MKHTVLVSIGMIISTLSYAAASEQEMTNQYVVSLNKEIFGSFDIRSFSEEERGSLQQVINDAATADAKLSVFKFTGRDKETIKAAQEQRDTSRILVAHRVTKAMLSNKSETSMAPLAADELVEELYASDDNPRPFDTYSKEQIEIMNKQIASFANLDVSDLDPSRRDFIIEQTRKIMERDLIFAALLEEESNKADFNTGRLAKVKADHEKLKKTIWTHMVLARLGKDGLVAACYKKYKKQD